MIICTLNYDHSPDSLLRCLKTSVKTPKTPYLHSWISWERKTAFHITLLILMATLPFQLSGQNTCSHLWLLSFPHPSMSTSSASPVDSKIFPASNHITPLTAILIQLTICPPWWVDSCFLSCSAMGLSTLPCYSPRWLPLNHTEICLSSSYLGTSQHLYADLSLGLECPSYRRPHGSHLGVRQHLYCQNKDNGIQQSV